MSRSWRFFVPPPIRIKAFPVFSEVDAVAGAKINLVLENATAHALCVGQVSLFYAR